MKRIIYLPILIGITGIVLFNFHTKQNDVKLHNEHFRIIVDFDRSVISDSVKVNYVNNI